MTHLLCLGGGNEDWKKPENISKEEECDMSQVPKRATQALVPVLSVAGLRVSKPSMKLAFSAHIRFEIIYN